MSAWRRAAARARRPCASSGSVAASRVRDVSFEAYRGRDPGRRGAHGVRPDGNDAGDLRRRSARSRGGLSARPRASPPAFASPSDAVRQGIALLTEDRKEQGLFLSLPVRANISITRLRRAEPARLDRFRAGAAGRPRSTSIRWASSAGPSSRRPGSSAAAISRRSSSPSGCSGTAISSFSTSRRGGSTSGPSSRSTGCSATSRPGARRSSSSPRTSRN